MENAEFNQETPRKRDRSRNKDRSEGPAYEQVAIKAVHREADYKIDSKPSVSTTVVGESVVFTQHFHF